MLAELWLVICCDLFFVVFGVDLFVVVQVGLMLRYRFIIGGGLLWFGFIGLRGCCCWITVLVLVWFDSAAGVLLCD